MWESPPGFLASDPIVIIIIIIIIVCSLKSDDKKLEGFSHAFYVTTNVLFVSLLYDTLKMVTIVTEICRWDK